MKNLRLIYSFFLILLIFSATTSTWARKIKCKEIDILTYESDVTPRPFVIIGKVQAEDSTKEKVICTIKKNALEHKADAIVKYTFTERPKLPVSQGPDAIFTIFPMTFGGSNEDTIKTVHGILVRWAKEGEKGITKITDKTPIPLLH